MKSHSEGLADVARYIEKHKDITLQQRERDMQSYLRIVSRFKTVDENIRILEIGTGLGWFPILCKARGLCCEGLEISPQLVRHAQELGRTVGVEPDIRLGNIEVADLGRSQYDVIIAYSVFEHVEFWQNALQKVYDALTTGGILLFESTNKFSLVSSEYDFPLYGWLPDRWRYRLRIARQGEDIMKLGIDFNQFTHRGLRRAFKEAGFSRIIDRLELADAAGPLKRLLVSLGRRVKPFGRMMLVFGDRTIFVCTKA